MQRGLVHREQCGAERGWTDDAAVQHAGDREILEIDVLSGALPRNIGPQERFTNHGITGWVLQRRLRVDLESQALPSHQRTDVNARATGDGPHLAIGEGQCRCRVPEALGAKREDGLACCRRGLAYLHRTTRNASAASSASLIGRERRVALDHRDALNRHAEFLRHHLAHGGAQTGADIHLARIDGDGTIGMHSEETVDLFQVKRLSEIGTGT
jgi:hypothetical protein